MINEDRVIALIPARGGSKGVPHKNIKLLAGKPLVVWSIEVALATPEIDRVIVSTDDARIGSVAIESGAEVYTRPAALAEDDSLVIDTVADLIARLRSEGESADLMVLLEPTSPLRGVADVSECLREFEADDLDSVATFTQAELNPHRAWKIHERCPTPFIEGANPWLPRQKLPEAYTLNGAVYAFRAGRLLKHGKNFLFGRSKAFIMPPERSVDIDTDLDFLVAESMLGENYNETFD